MIIKLGILKEYFIEDNKYDMYNMEFYKKLGFKIKKHIGEFDTLWVPIKDTICKNFDTIEEFGTFMHKHKNLTIRNGTIYVQAP